MTKKAKIEEFKRAFDKPSRPSDVTWKDKRTLESAVSELERQDFETRAATMYKNEPDYFVDLVVYKLAKHWGGDKQNYWINQVPQGALDRAMVKILSEANAEQLIVAASSLAAQPKALDHVLKKLDKAKAHETVIAALDNNVMMLPPMGDWPEYCAAAIEAGKGDVASLLFTNEADVGALATANPALFMSKILPKISKDAKLRVLKDPAVIRSLRGQTGWDTLVAETPMLGVVESVRSEDDPMSSAFTKVLENDGINVGYVGTSSERYEDILMTPSEVVKRLACHDFANLLKSLGEALGKKVKEGKIDKMTLTRPLNDFWNKGLVPRSFGNVVYKDGRNTNQIFFTGGPGVASHTWAIIDDVAYDPLFGTVGSEVAASVAGEFSWVVRDTLAKGPGGFLVPISDAPPSNPCGFSHAYMFVTNPGELGIGICGFELSTTIGKAIVASVDGTGPANGKLLMGDVITHINGAEATEPAVRQAMISAAGTAVTYTVTRNSDSVTAQVTNAPAE